MPDDTPANDEQRDLEAAYGRVHGAEPSGHADEGDAPDQADGEAMEADDSSPGGQPRRTRVVAMPRTVAAITPGAASVRAAETPPEGHAAQRGAPFGGGRWDVVRALRHRDYRLFFTGAFLSNIGGWLANVAQGYLVYDLTGSTALLGLLAFISQIPVLILGPIAGVTADRFHKKRILLITQSVLLVDYALIAILLFANSLQIWQLLTLSGISGIAMAFNGPAYQSLTVEFVGPEDLMNAIALNSMQFNLSRIVGGLAGGFLYVLLGKAWCFALDAMSFVAVIAALLMVNIRPPSPKARSFGIWENFVSGLRYLAAHQNLLAIVSMSAVVTIFILPYFTMLPVYAKDILRGDARMQSVLLTGVGSGALLAAFIQASSRDEQGKGLQMLTAMGVLSVCLVIFALSNNLVVSFVALTGLGAAMVGFQTSANTSMQLLIPDDMRGRLMGVFVMVSFGIGPIGALFVGLLANATSAPVALTIGAVICGLVTALATSRFPYIKRI